MVDEAYMRKTLFTLSKKVRLAFCVFYTWLWRSSLRECGTGVRIEFPVRFESPENITMGDNTLIYPRTWLNCVSGWAGAMYKGEIIMGRDVKISYNVQISAALQVVLEDGVCIAAGSVIVDHIHDYRYKDVSIFAAPISKPAAVRIGKGSFLGVHCFVAPGVQIGEHVVVSANAVVLRDVPSYSIVAGNPARAVRYDFHPEAVVAEPESVGAGNA
jgi:acetyltransferase-like isoleucine patch superfamily enzyme